MKKNPLVYNFVVFGIIIFTLSIYTIYLFIALQNNSHEGWEGFGFAFGYAILLVLSLVFDIASIVLIGITSIITIIDYLKHKRFRKGIYILINVIFILYEVICGVIFVSSLTTISADYPLTILSLGLFLIIIYPLILNTKNLMINAKAQ